MNKIRSVFPIILAALTSCGPKNSAENTEATTIDFTYELDTVMVDAGDNFIYLNRNLNSSGETHDGKYLYNFDPIKIALQVIDLENLVLEKSIPLELEGPNGIGSEFISEVFVTTDGDIILSDDFTISVIDNDGNKSFGFKYGKHDFKGEKLPEGKEIQSNEAFSKDGKKLVALYGEFMLDEYEDGVAVFDLENKLFHFKPLDIFKELEEHITILVIDDYEVSGSYIPIYLQLKGDSLIYSNSAKNVIYFLNLKTDSLTHKIYQSQYTSPEASGKYPKRTESKEEYRKIGKERNKEVSYGSIFFDDQNDLYWRFAKEMDHMKGDTIQYKTVLTAFDPEFNQLHEELLPSDFVLSYKYFARKGMIYTFLNIEDELAFIRLKPNFEND